MRYMTFISILSCSLPSCSVELTKTHIQPVRVNFDYLRYLPIKSSTSNPERQAADILGSSWVGNSALYTWAKRQLELCVQRPTYSRVVGSVTTEKRFTCEITVSTQIGSAMRIGSIWPMAKPGQARIESNCNRHLPYSSVGTTWSKFKRSVSHLWIIDTQCLDPTLPWRKVLSTAPSLDARKLMTIIWPLLALPDAKCYLFQTHVGRSSLFIIVAHNLQWNATTQKWEYAQFTKQMITP